MAIVDWSAGRLQAGAVALARNPADFRAEGTDWAVESEPAGAGETRTDAQLLGAMRRGSEGAIEVLFRRHWPNAHRAAFLIVRDSQAAEDIAQEAFISAIRALDGFDRRRPFRPWFHRIVVNRAIDHSRTRTLRREVGDEALASVPAQPPPELDADVLEALAELGPDQRAVVVLRHLLDYKPGEIARMLDLPRGTVNSRLRRALDQLRDGLGGDPE